MTPAMTPEQRAAMDRAKRGKFNVPITPRDPPNSDKIVPMHARPVRR